MTEKTNVEKVQEFHETFNHPVATEVALFPYKRGMERVGYIEEEVRELKEAIEDINLVEVADALLDLEYFINGTWVEIGLAPIKDLLFEEVHRSNMSKSCADMQEVQATIQHYKDNSILAFYEKVGERFVVYNNENNKILKSINYQKPNLKKIIEDYKQSIGQQENIE